MNDRQLVEHVRARPLNWHCIRCGWYCDHGQTNSYACQQCGELRALWAGSCTMRSCSGCGELSLAVAEYCEWCGAAMFNR